MNLEVNLKVPRWIVRSGSLLVNKLLRVLRKIYHGPPMGRESKTMRKTVLEKGVIIYGLSTYS
jgi:hypothetical protein